MFLRKSVFGTASMLGLAGILSVSACSSDNNQSGQNGRDEFGVTGSVGLALTLTDGSDVDVVNYVVTRNGVSVRTGTLSIGANNVASGTITGLEAGSGYLVQLTAPRTRDSGAVEPCVGQSSAFTVLAEQTVPVSVVLQCDDTSPDTGNITLEGTFNICPKITSASATPTTVAVGSSVTLGVSARDKDGDTLAYAWYTGTSYDAGAVFANTADASYTCTSAGTQTIGVRVFDGDARGCAKLLTPQFTVTCGGGPVETDAGPVDTDAGPVDVDAGTDAGPGPIDTDAGPVDTDAGPVVIDAGTDSGPVNPGARFGGAACETCLKTSCNPQFGLAGLEYVDQCVDAACDSIFACFQAAKCATGTTDVVNCYCGGNTPFETCQMDTYVATGPCKDQLETGLGTTVRREVFERFYDAQYAVADGTGLFLCASELCTDECLVNVR
jgi:hypothetical protein